MKISEKLKQNKINVSFEIFPPKTDTGYDSVVGAVNQIARLSPDFMSVTYGAGGGTSKNTVKIASYLQNQLGITSLAHLSCVSSTKSEVKTVIDELKKNNIQNILALRGDIPQGSSFPEPCQYQYAYQLIEDIKSQGDFCIGAACYPEGHVECLHKEDDIKYLKQKVDSGVDFLVTQMFFDNNILYNFLYRIREKGITVPVLPGIMPVTDGKQIKRIVALSGTELPTRFKAIVDRFADNPAAMQQAGIAYATEQIIDLLANGIKYIHILHHEQTLYRRKIMSNLSEILKIVEIKNGPSKKGNASISGLPTECGRRRHRSLGGRVPVAFKKYRHA